MRKYLILLMILVFSFSMVFVGVGCKEESAPVEEEAVEEESAPVEEEIVEEEKIEIKLWQHYYPPTNDFVTERIAVYMEKNPNISIEYTTIPISGIAGFEAKMLTALSGGSGPDIFTIGNWDYGVFVENELIAPYEYPCLDANSQEELVNAFIPGMLDGFLYDGVLYGVPQELAVMTMFYNKDAFDEEGIDYLSSDEAITWDDFIEIAQKLTKYDESGKMTQAGFVWASSFPDIHYAEWSMHTIHPLFFQAGQDDIYVDGEAAANTPEIKKAFQLYYDMIHKYETYEVGFPLSWGDDFVGQRVAMTAMASFFPGLLRAIDPDVRFGAAPLPVMADGEQKTVAWEYGWSLNPNLSGKKKEETYKFLKFIVGGINETEQDAMWAEQVGFFHGKKAYYESQEWSDLLEREPWINADFWTMSNMNPTFEEHTFDEEASAILRAMDRCAYDKLDVESSLDILQRELERGL